MGFRFRKSFKIAPGIRLNLSKKSSSLSFGGKGVRHTISTTGRRTTTVGIPGSGLSYSHTSGGRKSKPKADNAERENDMKKSKQKVKKPITKRWWFWPLIVCFVIGGIGNACSGKDAEKPVEETPVAVVEEAEVIAEATTEEVEEERGLGDPVGEVVFAPITYEDKEPEAEQEEASVVATDTPAVEEPVHQEPEAEDPVEVIVYITNTGEKYHKENCQYLRKSKIPISLDDAKAMYDPCSKCRP